MDLCKDMYIKNYLTLTPFFSAVILIHGILLLGPHCIFYCPQILAYYWQRTFPTLLSPVINVGSGH